MTDTTDQAALNLYARAEGLKAEGGANNKLELRKTYRRLLVDHLDYALDKKVEAELWSSFKAEITELQKTTRSSKPAKSVNAQTVLEWTLETAQGFYSVLLLEIQAASEAGSSREDQGSEARENEEYVRQHILVHLGDLARYMNATEQAEWFYRKAVVELPSYGHAYSQISLLESAKGRVLSAIFFTIRSLAVKNAFTIASANLSKSYERVLAKNSSPKSFIDMFLHFQAHLHQALNIRSKAAKICWKMGQKLTSEIATEALTSADLIDMVAVTLYQLQQLAPDLDSEAFSPSKDEKLMRSLLIETLASMLNAFLLPVYTLKVDLDSLASHFTLPAAKIILRYLLLNTESLAEPSFQRRMQIWPSLCKLLNELKDTTPSVDVKTVLEELVSDPRSPLLPEDFDMICFSPLPQHDEGRGRKPASPGDESEVRRLHLLKIGKDFADKHDVLSFDPDKGEFSVKIEPVAGQANGGDDELTKLFKDFESHQEEGGSESEEEDISKSSSSKKTLSPSADSDKSESPLPVTASSGGIIKKQPKVSKNAAMSAIMRRLEQKQDEIDSVSSGSVRPKVQFDVPATTTKVSPNSSNVKAKLDFLAETSGGVNQQQSRFVGLNGGPAPQVMMDHQINPIGKTTFPTASDSLRGSHYPTTSTHNLRMPPMSQFPPRPPIPSMPGVGGGQSKPQMPNFTVPPPPRPPLSEATSSTREEREEPPFRGREGGLPMFGSGFPLQRPSAGPLGPQPPQLDQRRHQGWAQHPQQTNMGQQPPKATLPPYAPLPIGSQRPGTSYRFGSPSPQQLQQHHQGLSSSSLPHAMKHQQQANNNMPPIHPSHFPATAATAVWGQNPVAAAGSNISTTANEQVINNQHLLFQPGPSTLEKLLQQNRQSNK